MRPPRVRGGAKVSIANAGCRRKAGGQPHNLDRLKWRQTSALGYSSYIMVLPDDRNILEKWALTQEELAEIIEANPSMRGLIFGYVAEYKVRKMWFSDERVEHVRKYDDHDREKKGDLALTYKGVEFTVEVKSLQTATVKKEDDTYTALFQCDASDRRTVILPTGETLQTTCLLVGGFDLLAVCIFHFGDAWRFAFAKNVDLPRSEYRRYTPQQRQHLLIEWDEDNVATQAAISRGTV